GGRLGPQLPRPQRRGDHRRQDAAIEAMLAACNRGPPAARVDAVEVTGWTDPVAAGFRFLETD
ncbi:MAG: hypothetical protein KKF33_02935, partial [Alphaproteobacteria bacterium]|nr:hypothetical protein [Alphaproteobacteria bacterium]